MKLAMLLGAAAAATLISAAPTYAADRLDMTFTGTLTDLTDSSGLFGSAKAGDAYTLTYYADFDLGQFGGGGGGFGGSTFLEGGSSFAADPNHPTVQTSPVSAALTIDGRTLYFIGADLGSAIYTSNSFDASGGNGTSNATLTAEDRAAGAGPADKIVSSITSDNFATFQDVASPMATRIDGTHVDGSSQFVYSVFDTALGHDVSLSGDLAPTFFETHISAAPEPSTWSLMIAGIGILGGALRARRRATGLSSSQA